MTLKYILRFVIVLAVLAGSFGVAYSLYASRDKADVVEAEVPAPLVEVAPLEPTSFEMEVRASGTVEASQTTTLTAEVAGRIIEVSPRLEVGSFFAAGDVLARIESRDYEIAVTTAEAEVANAEYGLELETAEAAAAIEEWRETSAEDAPPLVRRVPQLAVARARLEAAKGRLESAERDLARTRITAPYAGRVRSKSVDLGQFVARGTPLAVVFAIDYAEIRLPLHDRELAFLDLALDGAAQSPGAAIAIHGDFAGRSHVWHGAIARTEGELDPQSRMVHVIARVEDPYARRANGSATQRVPLLVGMFIEARIKGRRFDGVYVVPRHAVLEDKYVLVVDDMSRIRVREVEVLRLDDETVYIESGFAAEDTRICTTRLSTYLDGMLVRTREASVNR